MTHYWFGDSWVVGDELENEVPRDQRKNHVFAKLVSDWFNVTSINCGVSGSGPDALPWQFKQIVNQIKSGDTVFFCLSASHRVSIMNNDLDLLQIIPGPNYSRSRHPYAAEWFKYFDTEKHRIYNLDRSISLLWLWCQQLEITCYFLNLFTSLPDAVLDLTPKSAWLVPRSQCLSNFIMPISGDREGVVIDSDRDFLTEQQWFEQQSYLERYVRPNFCHPNLAGHQQIANELIKILQQK